jgi:hypothetical protein
MIGSRPAWRTAIALALLAIPTGGFLLLRPDQALESAAPEASGLPRIATPSSRPDRPPRPFAPSQLAAARSVARRFAAQYAGYVSGRVRGRGIADAAPELARQLDRHAPRVTPTQQHPPSLRRLAVEPAAGTVRAVATLQDSNAPEYRLAFYLERRGPRWLVTRLSDA